MRRRVVTGLALLATATAVGFVGASLAADEGQVQPSTQADAGVVNYAPGETLPAIGPDGEPIVCDDGQVLQVDPLKDNPPPGIANSDSRGGGDPKTPGDVSGAVPRCGPDGGGSDADPVWIPGSAAQSNPQNAPQSFVEP